MAVACERTTGLGEHSLQDSVRRQGRERSEGLGHGPARMQQTPSKARAQFWRKESSADWRGWTSDTTSAHDTTYLREIPT